jgi:hypothetical protein
VGVAGEGDVWGTGFSSNRGSGAMPLHWPEV